MAKANSAHHQALRAFPPWTPVVILLTTPYPSLLQLLAIGFVTLLAHLGHVVERGGESALPLLGCARRLGARILELHGDLLEVVEVLPDFRVGFALVILIGNFAIGDSTMLGPLREQRYVFIRHTADLVHGLGGRRGVERLHALDHLAAELRRRRHGLLHQIPPLLHCRYQIIIGGNCCRGAERDAHARTDDHHQLFLHYPSPLIGTAPTNLLAYRHRNACPAALAQRPTEASGLVIAFEDSGFSPPD